MSEKHPMEKRAIENILSLLDKYRLIFTERQMNRVMNEVGYRKSK